MKRRLHRLRAVALAACVACLPLAAQADPISLIAIGANLGFTGTAALVAGAVVTYGGYVAFAAQVIGALDARRRARKAANEARRAYNASLVDRTTVALAADPPLRAIYGRCIVGGDVVAVLTSDKIGVRDDGSTYVKPDGYKHVVVVIASRRIHAIHDVLIEGVPLGELDSDGWPTGGDTAVTRRAYLDLQMPVGSAYTAASALQVLSVIDAASGEAPPTHDFHVDYGRPTSYTLSGDGRTITNTSGFAVVASVAYDARVGTVRVSKFLGSPDQQADPWLLANVPALWTATDRLRGLAGIVLTLDLEDTSHQSGIPKVEIDASGFLVHDPRDGVMRFSRNPALIIRDHLTSDLGFGVTAGDIDDASVIAAANACDEAVPIGGTLQPRYTCDGTLTSDDDREAVLDDLADSMAGQVVQGPTWRLVAGAWAPSVMDLGDNDLAGQADVLQADTALEDLFNGARARIVPAGSGTVDEPVPYQNAALLAADGQALWTDVQLPYTNTAQRAKNLLRVMVERNRAGLVVRVPCTLRAWPLQVGDRVRWTSSEYGFTQLSMQVMDWQFGLTGAVLLTLQADAPDIYDLVDAPSDDLTPPSSLPRPWVVADVTGLTAGSDTSTLMRLADGTVAPRVRVAWLPVVDPYLAGGGFIRVRWRRPLLDAADVWQQQDLAPDARGAWLTGVSEGERLVIFVQAFNRLGAAGRAASVGHAVVGKSAPASNVAGLAGAAAAGVITWAWQAGVDLDHGYTEVRAADADWGRLTPPPLWRGLATSWQESVSAAGAVTRHVRHVDTTGHPSAATASATVNVTAAQLAGSGTPTNAAGAMNADPGCTTAAAWGLAGGAELGLASGTGAVGVGLIRFPAGALNSMAFSAESIPINPARRYRLSARLLVAAGNDRNMYVTVRMFRADGSEINGDPPPVGAGWGGTFAGYVFGGLPPVGGWSEQGADFGADTTLPIPSDASHVLVGVWGQYTAGSSSLDQYAQDVRLVDVTDVRTAQAAADAAAGAALAANTAIGFIVDDGVLSRDEKPGEVLRKAVLDGSYAGINASALAYGVTTERTAYATALSALGSYLDGLSPAWNDSTTHTTIERATYRSTWAAVYAAQQALLDKIAQQAGTVATWAGVSGAGKPASWATIGKSLGLPLDSWARAGQPLATVADGKVGSQVLRLTASSGSYPNQGNWVPVDASKQYRTRFWARPVGGADGLLYFSLRQFTAADAASAGPVNGGRSPYKPSGVTRAAHEAAFGAGGWGEYSDIWASADWQAGVKFVQPEFLDGYAGSTGWWEVQDFSFEEVTEVLAAQAAATAAATAAGIAQTAADSANTALAAIGSDDVLTKGEKPRVILDWTAIADERAGIEAQAVAYNIAGERTAYTAAVNALGTYLSGLMPVWSNLAADTPINGVAFRSAFAAVYSARQTVLNAIAMAAGTVATWVGVTGSGKPANGATVNRVTYGATAPGSPMDGDVWGDTSGTSVVIKLRVAGAWLSGANLSTGLLANLNAVATGQIDPNAVTEVMILSGGSVGWSNAL